MFTLMRFLILLLSLMLAASFPAFAADAWKDISLPHFYQYPKCETNKCPQAYSAQIPTEKLSVGKIFPYYEPSCKTFRSPSTRWVSDELPNIAGISFEGLIHKSRLGSKDNEFATFFHQVRCYGNDEDHLNGGMEYGFVFREDLKNGLFYLCGKCNSLKPPPDNQKWCQFPGNCKTVPNLNDDCAAVSKDLDYPSTHRYWNIKILPPNGNFLIELIDPATSISHTCTIQRPDWAPNLSNPTEATGYLTITAKKQSLPEETDPIPYMQFDQVRILNENSDTD